jgi:hypothetical protein
MEKENKSSTISGMWLCCHNWFFGTDKSRDIAILGNLCLEHVLE